MEIKTTEKLFTLNFILAFTANLLMMMAFYMLMPTLPFYFINSLGLEKTSVGVLISIYIISAVIIRPFSSYLIDSLNRKPFYVVMFLIYTLVFGGYIVFTVFTMILIVRVLHGFIWGIIIPLGNTLAIDVMPSSRRGSGIGYYGMSSNLAMALGPFAGLLILEQYGFNSIVVCSIAASILGLLAAITIRPPHKQPIHHNSPISLDRFVLVKAIPVAVNVMLVCFSYGLTVAYAALYGKEIGVHSTGLFFILFAAGIILARFASGKLIDKGIFNPISIASLFMLTIGFLLLGLFKNAEVYYSMAVFTGIACGMLFPAIQTMIVNFGAHNQRGTANSTYFTAFDIGVGLGMLAGGIIADHFSLSDAFLLSAVLNGIATAYYLKISAPSYKRYLTEKSGKE